MDLEKIIQEEIENADNTIIKDWYVSGRGVFYVKVSKINDSKVARRGYHTLYLTGTEREYLIWSNELNDKCDNEFKLIDCGEVKESETLIGQ